MEIYDLNLIRALNPSVFLLYRNENNGLTTFSAQMATMTESCIKHSEEEYSNLRGHP